MKQIAQSFWLGVCGGLLGGALLGLAEAVVILRSSAAAPDLGVLGYAALAYGLILAAIGGGLGIALAIAGKAVPRLQLQERTLYALACAVPLGLCGLAITAFRIRRDVYMEQLAWGSGQGLMVLGGVLIGALVLGLVLTLVLRLATARKPLSALLHPAGTPIVFVVIVAVLHGVALTARSEQALPDTSHRKAAPGAPNVLFIVIDTLRADHLPAYGYARGKTPNLDTFMKDAVRFDHGFTNASWTRPSFASILSGRYAASHRTMAKSDSLPDEIVTLPEALQDAGYTTLGIVTNYNVAPFFNFHQGFDHYTYLEPTFVLGANDTAAKLLFIQFLRQRIETIRAKSGHVEVGSAYQDAGVVNAEITRLLDQKPKAPFFLFAAYMDPHDPYYPHPYDGTAYSRAAHQKPDPADADKLRALYDGEITFWDEHFGKLVGELKRRGLYDDTLIVITSDHGEEFHDHGGFWHGTTLYDEQLRVPFLMKLPGSEMGGNVISHWVQSIDLMPSVLERAHVAIPKGVQGTSMFKGSERAFAEENHEGNVLRALRIKRAGTELKLITANERNPRGLAPSELYRVDQDPGEKVNVADEEPSLTGHLQAELVTQEKHAGEGRAAQRSVDVNADPASQEKLRALGYAGGDE